MIVRKKLTPDEISNPSIRVNPDTDEVEQSPDGGATWMPAPALDPRHADGFRAPPLETADPRCDGAAGMVSLIQSLINISINRLSAGAAATGFLATFLALIPLGGIIADIILGTASALFAIGALALSELFTSEIYDQLLCIFYDNIAEDGQVDSAALAAIRAQITSDIGDGVDTVMQLLLDTVGEVGLSNAGAVYALTGDCETCLNCQEFLDGDDSYSRFTTYPPYSEYDSGNDWVGGDQPVALLGISLAELGFTPVSMHVVVDRSGMSDNIGAFNIFAANDPDTDFTYLYSLTELDNGEELEGTSFTFPEGYSHLWFNAQASGGIVTIKHVQIC
jgi:hypothetical protein